MSSVFANSDELQLQSRALNSAMERAYGSPQGTKVFARPFLLALKREDTIVWMRVATLDGLRSVAERVESGELVELDRYSTLEMQLWGHLASHVGFIRGEENDTTGASDGIQPLGQGVAALAADMDELTGHKGLGGALDFIGELRRLTEGARVVRSPIGEATECAEGEAGHYGTFTNNGLLTPGGEEVAAGIVACTDWDRPNEVESQVAIAGSTGDNVATDQGTAAATEEEEDAQPTDTGVPPEAATSGDNPDAGNKPTA